MKLNSIVQQAGTYQVKPQPKKAVSSVVDDQKTTTQNSAQIRTSEQGIALVEQFQSQQSSTIYDRPNFRTGQAISEYRAIATEARRDEIKSMIGVSVYA
ncbi:hypothetical protein [Pseudoalteromonas piscicida]|uniref:hypothetical protein n=1 Tax=Pseudoalteromonas piscicida TaxID=43662 RepID=UPI0030A9235B